MDHLAGIFLDFEVYQIFGPRVSMLWSRCSIRSRNMGIPVSEYLLVPLPHQAWNTHQVIYPGISHILALSPDVISIEVLVPILR